MGFRNLLRKRVILKQHQFRNLIISLPSHWHFEMENEDTELCYDASLRSSLRISFIFATYKDQINKLDHEKKLTDRKRYQITSKGYIFLEPVNTDTVEDETNLKITRWELINYDNQEVVCCILSYTVPTDDLTETERHTLKLIEKSLLDAQLLDYYAD
jgi:hypothetical protein